MAMAGKSGVAEINVTPLIDVLLVLLIIFMVLVPVAPHGLSALVPQPPLSASADPPPRTVVVEILAGAPGHPAEYRINQQPLARTAITAELQTIFAGRQDRTIFLRADPTLEYGTVADVVNLAHAAVDNIGIITPRLELAANAPTPPR